MSVLWISLSFERKTYLGTCNFFFSFFFQDKFLDVNEKMLVVPEDYNFLYFTSKIVWWMNGKENSDTLNLLLWKALLLCALNLSAVLMATAAAWYIPHISFSQKLAFILPHTQRTRVVVAIDAHLCELVWFPKYYVYQLNFSKTDSVHSIVALRSELGGAAMAAAWYVPHISL